MDNGRNKKNYRRDPTSLEYPNTFRPHQRQCSSSPMDCLWIVYYSRSSRAGAYGSKRRMPNHPWNSSGSSVRLRSCKVLSYVGTTRADLPWRSFLPLRCLGWRNGEWSSRSYPKSSSSFHLRFLLHQLIPVLHLEVERKCIIIWTTQ